MRSKYSLNNNQFDIVFNKLDIYTHGHSIRVGAICRMLAADLCDELRKKYAGNQDIGSINNDMLLAYVYDGGCYHDIGKLFVSKALITSKEKLSEAEYEIIKEHVNYSESIIGEYKNCFTPDIHYNIVFDMIVYHHEKYCGGGYFRNLTGDEIPLAAQICSVADAYDALVSVRSYKKPVGFIRAKEIILSESGRCFSPVVVNSFKKNADNMQDYYIMREKYLTLKADKSVKNR